MKHRELSDIQKIIIHCSASPMGPQSEIRQWHTLPKPKGNGWDDNGYNFVISNGRIVGLGVLPSTDGSIESGRPLYYAGAHCKGHNSDSVGICLIGDGEDENGNPLGLAQYTSAQRESLLALVGDLIEKLGLTWGDVFGHNEFDSGKTCPGFDVEVLRRAGRERESLTALAQFSPGE